MALFSPAYLAINQGVLANLTPVLQVTDRNEDEKNFIAHYALPVKFEVVNAINQNYRSQITLVQAAFTGAYKVKIFNVSLFVDGYTIINQNAINSRVPVNIDSNMLSLDLLNLISISQGQTPGGLLQFSSTANNLENLWLANQNNLKEYVEKIVVNPFYNPEQKVSPVSLPVRRKLDFPVEYRVDSSVPDFYVNMLLGIGLPDSIYNIDCSAVGNGLLDYEFSVVDNPYHSTNYGSYGSRYVFRDLPNDDLSAKIVSLNLIYNIIVQGMILK